MVLFYMSFRWTSSSIVSQWCDQGWHMRLLAWCNLPRVHCGNARWPTLRVVVQSSSSTLGSTTWVHWNGTEAWSEENQRPPWIVGFQPCYHLWTTTTVCVGNALLGFALLALLELALVDKFWHDWASCWTACGCHGRLLLSWLLVVAWSRWTMVST